MAPREVHLQGSETILIVDDEQAIRGVASAILTRYGYKVLEAANGDQARVVFNQHGHKIALLLTDVIMPPPSGPDLAAELLGRNPALKVIYMSGFGTDPLVRDRVFGEGHELLAKPFTINDLVHRVRLMLDNSKTLAATT